MGKADVLRGTVVASLLLGSGCGGGSLPATGPTPAPPLAPALVQVENLPAVRPQTGLQAADLVFEYLTEGGITRFTAVYFDLSGSGRIEPVRSARPISIVLVRAYGGVLFFSGASSHVLSQIQAENLPALPESSDGGRFFTRDPGRSPPHNLTTTTEQLRQGVETFNLYRRYALRDGRPAGAGEALTRFSFRQTPSHLVAYTYSTANAYTYSTDTGPMADAATGQPLRIVNVVLVRVAHHDAGFTDVNGAPAVAFDLQGTGPADIYTGGQHFSATWDLTSPTQPLRFVGPDGQPMLLPHGLTWIHLVDPDTRVTGS
jgi:DUF3048 family protein